MLNDLLKKCRSYRSFAPDVRISEEILLECIENARIANATMNVQPLKYRLVTKDEEIAKVLPLTRWATALGIKLPPAGHEPTAFIVVCHDEQVIPFAPMFLKDVGICSEIIMLSAAERGFGGCMIGSADSKEIAKALSLPENLLPQLVLALGKPDEEIILEETTDGSVKYYRDENNIHHSPKRKIEDVVLR
jgi:nitroreductase